MKTRLKRRCSYISKTHSYYTEKTHLLPAPITLGYHSGGTGNVLPSPFHSPTVFVGKVLK